MHMLDIAAAAAVCDAYVAIAIDFTCFLLTVQHFEPIPNIENSSKHRAVVVVVVVDYLDCSFFAYDSLLENIPS